MLGESALSLIGHLEQCIKPKFLFKCRQCSRTHKEACSFWLRNVHRDLEEDQWLLNEKQFIRLNDELMRLRKKGVMPKSIKLNRSDVRNVVIAVGLDEVSKLDCMTFIIK